MFWCVYFFIIIQARSVREFVVGKRNNPQSQPSGSWISQVHRISWRTEGRGVRGGGGGGGGRSVHICGPGRTRRHRVRVVSFLSPEEMGADAHCWHPPCLEMRLNALACWGGGGCLVCAVVHRLWDFSLKAVVIYSCLDIFATISK